MKELILIFIATVLVNNFVLKYFLGICPFLGVSGKIDSAVGMGLATTFVMTVTAPTAWLINTFILKRFELPFLQYVTFIIVIPWNIPSFNNEQLRHSFLRAFFGFKGL